MGNVDYKFNVILNDTTAADSINYDYIMTQVGKLDPISLNSTTSNIIKSDIIVKAGTSVPIYIRVYLSSDIPNTEVGKNFAAKLSIDGIAVSYDKGELDNSDLIANYYYIGMPLSELSPGSYISMTPTSTSYTTDTSMTGYSSSQTINPSELNLWRMLNVNDDGTVDMISERVSSTVVTFYGKEGYKNFVGHLNVLASQYENSTYTTGSRYFGYNGQTEYITDTSMINIDTPWRCSTGESGCGTVESQGGGDTLYTNDYNLVNDVLGTIIATNPSGTTTGYWIASRYYLFFSDDLYPDDFYLEGRYIDSSGSLQHYCFYGIDYNYYHSWSYSNHIRPILTLKSTIYVSGGSGTYEDPYTISNDVVAKNMEVDYTGGYQTFTAAKTGKYKIELWGAQGGSNSPDNPGGKGAYTSGEIFLSKGEKLYIYVGDYGYQPDNLIKPFNGGGAPDINGTWGDSKSGMFFSDGSSGGVGGALSGGTTTDANSGTEVSIPTQTSGNAFGVGQSSGTYPDDGGADTGAGGGGYFGGYRGLSTIVEVLEAHPIFQDILDV